MANLIYRNQANKIFIYNSAEEADNNPNICINDEHIEPKNTSSITILTSGIPEYHIRIKNNFKSEDFADTGADAKGIAAEPMVNGAKPHRTEVFSMNEDVLLKSLDDKLYLGTVVNIQNGKYLVKFDDNTEKWSCERGLKKLNSSINKTDNDDEPLCVICKERSDTDVVEVCHKCSRGYHRQCMKDCKSNFSSPWCCDRCTANEIISISDSEDNESDVAMTVDAIAKLPYDVSGFVQADEFLVNIYDSYLLFALRSRRSSGTPSIKLIKSRLTAIAEKQGYGRVRCCSVVNASSGSIKNVRVSSRAILCTATHFSCFVVQ